MGTAALRRLKKKRQKETDDVRLGQRPGTASVLGTKLTTTLSLHDQSDVIVEYVAPETVDAAKLPTEFAEVFEKFKLPNEPEAQANALPTESYEDELEPLEQSHPLEMAAADMAVNPATLGKKKLRKLLQVSLAALKEYARRPELVEWEDVSGRDPRFLVQLKGVRNSVPVPKHWSRKRKYLAGKRGFVKPPFQLPSFIAATGITELRETMRGEDAEKSVKVRARERMHPKLGRLSIDYERLHDAFFLHQTKPKLTQHGDLYWEGREFSGAKGAGASSASGSTASNRPGFLSEELRSALGLSNALHPPPWLFNMQRWGPPPAYPFLRVAGVNAPIPPGAQWGFHPGGWGRPPLGDATWISDALGGTDSAASGIATELLEPVDRATWGEFEPDEDLPEELEDNLPDAEPENE